MREATDRQKPTAERVAELRAMAYDDYLASSEWQATRQRALTRAGHRCQVCGRRSRLNVHHNDYARRGAEEDRDLIVLCGGEDGCHALYHHAGRLAQATGGRLPFAVQPRVLSLPVRTSYSGPTHGLPPPLRPRRPRRRPRRWLRRIAVPVRIGAGLLLLGLLILIIARHGG